MSCPRCGAEMRGGVCTECGFPVTRMGKNVKMCRQGLIRNVVLGKEKVKKL